jgi:hypothetical protein
LSHEIEFEPAGLASNRDRWDSQLTIEPDRATVFLYKVVAVPVNLQLFF